MAGLVSMFHVLLLISINDLTNMQQYIGEINTVYVRMPDIFWSSDEWYNLDN